MGEENILMWVLLLGVFAACVWWHLRENKALTEQWRKDMDATAAHWLVRFAWSRTIQLLAALACCILIIIVYDIQLSDARHDLDMLSAKSEEDQKQIENYKKALAEQQARQQTPVAVAQTPAQPVVLSTDAPVAAPAATNSNPPGATQSALDNALGDNPTLTAIPDAAQKSAPSTAQTVDDLYNPEKNATDPQSNMDDIKKRYEDVLVIYMFLKKCNRVNTADYNIIISALGQEIAAVNAPGHLQTDILSAAKGSYQEMYSQSSCREKGVNTLFAQYNDYIKALSNNFPPQ